MLTETEPKAEIELREGMRVRGLSLEKEPLEGIITSLGNRYARLDGDRKKSVWIESIEILEVNPAPLPWTFIPNFLGEEDADEWFNLSQILVEWSHNDIRMFGKDIPLPRLEAIIGNGDYSYSGITLKAQPWTDEFAALKRTIEGVSGYEFEIAIGNQYRNGADHIGWHSDDSPEMGDRPAIASLSLGATRKFRLRNKKTKEIHTFELTHGSLFIMHPGCQEKWQHQICKTSSEVGLRINWTFRPLVGQTQEATSNQGADSSNPVFQVGDLLETSDGYLGVIEGWDRDGYTVALSNGKYLTGTDIQLHQWGYQKVWSQGDRVTPKHAPGSRYGTITGFNIKNKKTPLLIQFDGSNTEGKWGKDAVILAECGQPLAPIIDAEIVDDRGPRLAALESKIADGIAQREKAEQQIWVAAAIIRDDRLWEGQYKSFEAYCKERWGWEKSNAHEVAGAGEVVLQLKQAGVDAPKSVAAIRPLRQLPPEQRVEVVKAAQAESGKLTAQAVKQAVAVVAQPKLVAPPVPATLGPPPSEGDRPWALGDWVEGTDDDGNLIRGTVAAIGTGYLRLSDGNAVYAPRLLQPFEYANPALPEEQEPNTELKPDERQLLKQFKEIARRQSDEIYKALIKLGIPADEHLINLTTGLEESIAEALEFEFLGDSGL